MVFDKEQAVERFAKASIAFIGTMSQVIPGISTRSMPPINHYKLKFDNIRKLRGSVQATEFTYHQRGAGGFSINVSQSPTSNASQLQDVKVPTVGVLYLTCSDDGQHINTLVEVDNTTVDQLIQSSKMPLGWTKQPNGNYESPWQHSHIKHAAWYDNQCFTGHEKCAKSGRPLLITADDISITCEPVQAIHVKEYQNPDGDGVFKITIRNMSNRSIEIPALLRDTQSKQILWEESIFVMTDAGNHFFPGHGQARDVESTIIEPHESVTAKLDTLTLRDLAWPQGGWRLYLKFCLGDKSADGNYYYFTDHHDPLRKTSEKKKTAIVE